MRAFDYDLDYKNLGFRMQPELYRVGRGEQGVLLVEPYKSEILPHWRFATPHIAIESSETIYQMFLDYLADGDFVGADMAHIFKQKWDLCRENKAYLTMKAEHCERYKEFE
jgi:hypothetical protein